MPIIYIFPRKQISTQNIPGFISTTSWIISHQPKTRHKPPLWVTNFGHHMFCWSFPQKLHSNRIPVSLGRSVVTQEALHHRLLIHGVHLQVVGFQSSSEILTSRKSWLANNIPWCIYWKKTYWYSIDWPYEYQYLMLTPSIVRRKIEYSRSKNKNINNYSKATLEAYIAFPPKKNLVFRGLSSLFQDEHTWKNSTSHSHLHQRSFRGTACWFGLEQWSHPKRKPGLPLSDPRVTGAYGVPAYDPDFGFALRPLHY